MKTKEHVVSLKGTHTCKDAYGEIYFTAAVPQGIYITAILRGMQSIQQESVLTIQYLDHSDTFPLPKPCEGLIEVSIRNYCISLEDLMNATVFIRGRTHQTLLKSESNPMKVST